MNGYEAGVAGIAIMLPVFLVLAFRSGRRRDGVTAEDLQHMHSLTETAQRMEQRIESLELLLDTEVPGWRNRSGLT
jgi:phage shock protein B